MPALREYHIEGKVPGSLDWQKHVPAACRMEAARDVQATAPPRPGWTWAGVCTMSHITGADSVFGSTMAMHRLAVAMKRWLCLVVLTGVQSCAAVPGNDQDDLSRVTIRTVTLKVTDKALTWRYRIVNRSKQDIWLCEDIALYGRHFEVYLAEDRQTLMIRRRFDVSAEGNLPIMQPNGSFVRLRAGQSRTESLRLPLPVQEHTLFAQSALGPGYMLAERLVLEIGYYGTDWRDRCLARRRNSERRDSSPAYAGYHTIPAPVAFVLRQEEGATKEDRFRVPYDSFTSSTEARVLRLTKDNQSILYLDTRRPPKVVPGPPDVSDCTRAEVRYRPSMLEYFFPYPAQQGLLEPAERKYLRSQKAAVIDSAECLQAFAAEIRVGRPNEIVPEGVTAEVVCYRNEGSPTSLKPYGDRCLEAGEGERFRYPYGGMQSLREFTPQIRPFWLRIRCAEHLKDLWHRINVYRIARDDATREAHLSGSPNESGVVYPEPNKWCDVMLWAYARSVNLPEDNLAGPYKCPAAREGKCHYAMNPACRPDSPPGTVLLFETKAGWNQHGGPELFAFDNHDPHGGCVLLNDGTVKFIRTEAELRQLRWK
jgi:hypothetical protein